MPRRSREPNDMRAVVNASAGCTRRAAPARWAPRAREPRL